MKEHYYIGPALQKVNSILSPAFTAFHKKQQASVNTLCDITRGGLSTNPERSGLLCSRTAVKSERKVQR